jgi:hypothetical protein
MSAEKEFPFEMPPDFRLRKVERVIDLFDDAMAALRQWKLEQEVEKFRAEVCQCLNMRTGKQ